MSQTFIVPADNREAAIERLARFLAQALPGKPLRVTVEEYRKRRSDEQNKFWWGVVVKTFCDHLPGWEPEDVHTYLCGEHFGWERIEGMGRVKMRPVKRSSRLNKLEFSELVAKAQKLAAEHGFYVPDPE